MANGAYRRLDPLTPMGGHGIIPEGDRGLQGGGMDLPHQEIVPYAEAVGVFLVCR